METKETTVVTKTEEEKSDTGKKIKKDSKIKKMLSKVPLQTKIIIILSLVLVLIVAALIAKSSNDKVTLTTVAKSSLQQVIEITELSTVDYTYNAVATKNDKNNKALYYVAYEGTVTAGIDFSKVSIDIIEEEKKVLITLPDVEIHATKVDMGTMEYIFTKDKYETEDISQEAYKLCKEDLNEKIKAENTLYETARENAKSSVEALFKPWIDTIDDSYAVEIK